MTYIDAGRAYRALAWLQIVLLLIVTAAIGFPMLAQHHATMIDVVPLVILVALLILIPLLYFKVGKAIREHKPWGRTVGIVLGCLMLVGFPIGTIAGAYILWGLIKCWDQAADAPAP